MDLYIGNSGTGKTTKMINHCIEQGKIMVVYDSKTAVCLKKSHPDLKVFALKDLMRKDGSIHPSEGKQLCFEGLDAILAELLGVDCNQIQEGAAIFHTDITVYQMKLLSDPFHSEKTILQKD